MEEISLISNPNGQQAFVINGSDRKLAEMVVRIQEDTMTVYHTEVDPSAEGKGLGKALLEAMADHARGHQLKVVPLCTFVLAQFKRHPESYESIWQKEPLDGGKM